MSRLKDSLTENEAHLQKEIDNQRTSSDRIIWDFRMKLQKMTESSYDLKQQLEEKHREEMGK